MEAKRKVLDRWAAELRRIVGTRNPSRNRV